MSVEPYVIPIDNYRQDYYNRFQSALADGKIKPFAR